MDHGGQQDAMNITRAREVLSSYLNNSRRTVIWIEACVAGSVTLLFLQLILGSCRRRSSNSLIHGALWLSYTLSFPLIAYTLGQMLSSPVKTELYPLWSVLIFWVAGCTNSMTAYNLDDNKQWKRYLFELLQYFTYAVIIYQLLRPTKHVLSLSPMVIPEHPITISIYYLAAVVLFTNLVRAMAGWIATNSYHSKVVADYMRDEVDHIVKGQVSSDPITMQSYRYIVFLPSHLLFGLKTVGPTYRNKLPADGIVTMDAIWKKKFDGSLLNTDGGGSGLNDVCLSFALSHLLKRRFFGMECAEAAHEETRKFVFEDLLSNPDGVTRAFHIIEVELGFLYEFFFTKYAALFYMERSFIAMVVLKIILLSISVAALLGRSLSIATHSPVIEVGTRSVDVSITIVIMGILLLVEALQAILYLMSDWGTVSLACGYTRRGTCNKLIPFVIWFLRRFNLSKYWKSMISDTNFCKSLGRLNLFGYWENEMGQWSVFKVPETEMIRWFQDTYCGRSRILVWLDDLLSQAYFSAFCTYYEYMAGPIISSIYPTCRKTSIGVPDLVKREIISCLQKTSIDGPLTNGEEALQCNAVLGEFSWTLNNRSQTMTMLIWHIATEHCSFPSSSEMEEHPSGVQDEEIDNYKQVAIILSRYCLYLIAFVPALLPGNSTDTQLVYRGVLNEVQRYQKPFRDELLKAFKERCGGNEEDDTIADGSTNNNNEDTIFVKGLKLWEKLEGIEDRWKVMAEFWAETIIYIAPSDNATAHMECLAKGGEFLTHVWALLTHAGILQRDQKQTPENMV